MKEKLLKIGGKTGLEAREVNNLTKIGVSGIMALALSLFGYLGSPAGAAEAKSQAGHDANRTVPEKCKIIPDKTDCSSSRATYYYDARTYSCKVARACGKFIFNNRTECVQTCVPPEKRQIYPVVKYGAVNRRDFRDAK